MLRLSVENTEQSEATIPIRWCVSPEILDELKGREVRNPFLLISVSYVETRDSGRPSKKEVDRLLVPLGDALAFIQLRQAGHHVINVGIVFRRHDLEKANWEDAHALEKFFLTGTNGRFDYEITDGVGDFLLGCGGLNGHPNNALKYVSQIEVDVDGRFFAAEPSELESRWVNFWFASRPADQCSFRKRRIVAYSIQPPLVLVWTFFITALRMLYASWLLLLCMRGVQFSPIIHPFRKRTVDVRNNGTYESDFWSLENNFLLSNAKGKWRHPTVCHIHPLVLLIEFLVLWAAWWAHIFSVALGVFGFLNLVMLTIFLWPAGGIPWMKKVKKQTAPPLRVSKEVEAYERDRRAKALALETRYQELGDIVCSGCDPEVPLLARVDALPKRRQTFWLRYEHTKAMVCRPYAVKR